MVNGIEHEGASEKPARNSESNKEHDETVARIAHKFIGLHEKVKKKIDHGADMIELTEPVDISSSDNTQEAVELATDYYNKKGFRAGWGFSSVSSKGGESDQKFELKIVPDSDNIKRSDV